MTFIVVCGRIYSVLQVPVEHHTRVANRRALLLLCHFVDEMAVASLTGTQILFAFPRGEVMPMFVTWELLFLLAGFIIALLTYIDNHNKKN